MKVIYRIYSAETRSVSATPYWEKHGDMPVSPIGLTAIQHSSGFMHLFMGANVVWSSTEDAFVLYSSYGQNDEQLGQILAREKGWERREPAE